MKQVRYILVFVILAVMLVSGCGSPGINFEDASGFICKASSRVPFTGDTPAILFASDQGRASLFFPNEKSLGHVNAEKEYSPELYGLHPGGSVFHNDYGTFQQIRIERENRYFYGARDTDFVTEAIFNELGSGAWFNERLAGMLLNVPDMTLFDHVITYNLGLSSGPYNERWQFIYDIDTGEQAMADLRKDYISVDTIDVLDDNILMKAHIDGENSPDFYVLGTDGKIRVQVTPIYCDDARLCTACFTANGIFVYAPYMKDRSTLTKYNWYGSPEWAHTLPFQGNPELKIHETDGEIITLTAWDDDARYIEYTDTENGTMLFSRTFQTDSFITLTDFPGRYYVCPRWSGYPEEDPPTGRISLFKDDNEIAHVEITDGIYYFEASPQGDYFSVVTEKTVSLFSLDKKGG